MTICAVLGCSNRSDRDNQFSYFRFPSVRERFNSSLKELLKDRRHLWIQRINRRGFTDAQAHYARVCSNHFISGKPCDIKDRNNPDWAPSLNLGHQKVKNIDAAVARYKRNLQRSVLKTQVPVVLQEEEREISPSPIDTEQNIEEREISPSPIDTEQNIEEREISPSPTHIEEIEIQPERPFADACVNTDLKFQAISLIENDNLNLLTKVHELQKKLSTCTMDESFFSNYKNVLYYTGLPNKKILDIVFETIQSNIQHTKSNSVTKFQEFILFLVKLRLNSDFQDLGNRFFIAESTASRIFYKWLNAFYIVLKNLITWPEREPLMMTMPLSFRLAFGTHVAVIIDCFELFINRPSSMITRSATWSNYKHHNTIKYLIGITPQGTISFLSEGYGGRVTDQQITEECGILKKLLPGDIVLADRGFMNLSESVGFCCAKLLMPTSARGKLQLSAEEVRETREISSVRIHVERVIGQVKKKFKILKHVIPIDFLTKKSGDEIPPFDKIMHVCCALTNLTPSVVSK